MKVGQTWQDSVRAPFNIVAVDDGGDLVLVTRADMKGRSTWVRKRSLIEQLTRVFIAPGLCEGDYDTCAAEYRKRGCFVVDTREDVPGGVRPSDFMQIDIAALITCEMIVMLPGWLQSKSSKGLFDVAMMCGLTVAYWG